MPAAARPGAAVATLPDVDCPCGRTGGRRQRLRLAACCGPYLDGLQRAPDAEALMRARYTAFVRERADYLLATWHPAHRPVSLDFEPGAKWLGLDVRAHRVTGPDTAEVEFVARHRGGGRAVRLHERSRCVRLPQGWVYVDGDSL